MRTLVVGAGALGGVVAGRLAAAGRPVWLATRDASSAAALRESGVRVTGIGGDAFARVEVAPLDAYRGSASFDAVVLATKAHDALAIAPALVPLLAPGGALVPIQNGGVPPMLAERLGPERVLPGLSNLGATRIAPGVYAQRNAGHLLVGELAGGTSERGERVRASFSPAVEVRVTAEIRGAVWSKLLLNCSVTSIGAVLGRTMQEYLPLPGARALFDAAYDEALAVALASGARPVRMLVEPIPPRRRATEARAEDDDAWLAEVLAGYGGVRSSMLDDLEHGRRTEIEFINGYVVGVGATLRVPTPANAAIVEAVEAISRERLRPDPALLERVLAVSGAPRGSPGAGPP